MDPAVVIDVELDSFPDRIFARPILRCEPLVYDGSFRSGLTIACHEFTTTLHGETQRLKISGSDDDGRNLRECSIAVRDASIGKFQRHGKSAIRGQVRRQRDGFEVRYSAQP